jgi:hypothetical protein
MGRRVSVGIAPAGFGGIAVDNNTIETAQTNQNLILSPNGTGEIRATADVVLQGQKDLRFGDSDSSNYVGFQAPGTVAANIIWTLPAADGTANQILATNASGTLSWASQSVDVSDQTVSSSTFYPLFSANTSGLQSNINVSSTKLTYIPSTGSLISTIGQFPIVQGGTGVTNNLVLRSTTNASKGQVWIDETTSSSSTTTGALRVSGGMGVAGTGFFNALSTGNLTATGTVEFTGSVRVQELIEDLIDVAQSSNVVGIDYNNGNIYYLSNTPAANMTFNFTNVPTTDGRISTMNVFVTQGSTGYIPSTFTINGSGVTIKWAGNSAPTPTSTNGRIDVFTFTFIRRSGAYILLGAITANF